MVLSILFHPAEERVFNGRRRHPGSGEVSAQGRSRGCPRNHGLTLRAHHPHDLLGVACTAYEPSLWASATAFLPIPPLQRARHRNRWPQENHIADGVFTQLGSQKYMPSVPRSQIVLISTALARFAAQRPKSKLAMACVWSAEEPRTRPGLSEVRFEIGSKNQ